MKASEIETVLNAVLRRYKTLFPEWDVSVISLNKEENRREQLDKTIAMLKKMKETDK